MWTIVRESIAGVYETEADAREAIRKELALPSNSLIALRLTDEDGEHTYNFER